MSQYISIMIWFGFLFVLVSMKDFKKTEVVCGQTVKRYPFWFAAAAFAPIIWMAGSRGWIGDTWAYLAQYIQMPRSLSALPWYVNRIEKDKGFIVLSMIIKLFAGNDTLIYLMVLAIIQGVVIIAIFRKYSPSYLLSIFLFVASADYVSWMMNGLRQFMAVTIIFAATGLMLKKKYVALIIVVLIASTMHQSALIAIPLILVAQGKAWNRKTLIFICVALVVITFVGQFTSILEESLVDTQYKNVMNDADLFADDGTNPIRAFVYSIPAILSFVIRRKIRRLDDPIINLCTNMSIISMGLYLVSVVTSGVFIGRLPIYVSLYSYMLLPWEIDNMFKRNSRRLAYMTVAGMYLLYYYYQMHFAWGMI